MRNAIDVDVGGTFTDLVLTHDEHTVYRKTPTTPYDLSVGFMQAIEEGATAVGMSVDELLPEIDVVRYSTTVAMNRLIERKGPRLGLITTEGHEDASIIGRGAQWVDGTRLDERRDLPHMDKPEPLISRSMIVGVKERIDARGNIARPLDEDDARRKIRHLVDSGARAFVVALLWSFVNPEHEQRVREMIRDEYRGCHVGYLPVILSSDVVRRLGEYERIMTSVLDAYLQRSMQLELSGTWDKLRERGYRGPFMMVHNTGGCADIFKTTASRTYNGGPISGLIGARDIARQLGYANVVTADVGGTSFDIGLVVASDVRNYDYNPIIDRWMVAITMLQSLSIGAGGGSIAWVNELLSNRLEVGPESAGSYPGPACYNLGGTEPTTTDADLVLGYINSNNYFGGRMQLDRDLAEQAIREKVAEPLGLQVVEAAALIRRLVDEKMASAIRKEVVLRGYRPEDFTVFALGGGGATHAAAYRGDIPRVVVFPYSPVFCAFGSSIMDVLHVYEKSQRMTLIAPRTGVPVVDLDAFNSAVNELLTRAREDFEAEGLASDEVVFTLELEMLYGGQINSKRTSTPGLFMRDSDDVWEFYRRFEQEFSETFSPLIVNLPGGVYIDTFVLRAHLPGEPAQLTRSTLAGTDPSAAAKEPRDAYWPETGGWASTPVFDGALMEPGNVTNGPSIVETEYTTVVVPPGLLYRIDEYGLGIMEPMPHGHRTKD